MKEKNSYDHLFRWLFHILFWTLQLGWPFINRSGDIDKDRAFLAMVTQSNLLNLIYYFIILKVLSPRYLKSREFGFYFLWLFVLIVIWATIQYNLRCSHGFPPKALDWTRFIDFRILFSVLYIGAAATAYGLMTSIIDEEKSKEELQNESIKAELSFLRSQISPHFIFNILNSIVFLTGSKPDKARSVTIKLSELLRYMLYDSETQHVPIKKEIEYLENYIDLQKVRFDDDVDIQYTFSGTPRNQYIEPMLLVPFVENAFKHGVGNVLNPKIDINLNLADKLEFTVSNTFAPENAATKNESSGIGLKNVKRRLELLYPNSHQLDLSNENGIFTIKLHLDLRHT